MTEPENFEEDLFADLYTEDDNTSSKPSRLATKVETTPVISAEPKEEGPAEQNGQDGDEDQQVYGGEQDMDDEIDFNLGNGNGYDVPVHHEAHGPGIKEDG